MSDFPNNSDGAEKWLRVDVRGENPKLWATLRESFVKQIGRLMELTLDHERGSTVRDEVHEFTGALLDFAKAKLAMPGLEADKLSAEIGKIFAERQTEPARAEKTSEEARQLRIKNDIAKLRMMLGATKAMLIGDGGDDAVLFGKQIDAFLDVLKEIAQSSDFQKAKRDVAYESAAADIVLVRRCL